MEKKQLEVPKPPKSLRQGIALDEEELKYVPEAKKDYYLAVKENDPDIARKLLEGYRADAEQVRAMEQKVQLVTENQLILMKLEHIEQMLEKLTA